MAMNAKVHSVERLASIVLERRIRFERVSSNL